MEQKYWTEKWDTGDIAFHQSQFNPLMVTHFPSLGLDAGARVFVPLCGKTRDIAWLLHQGYIVSGIELHEGAVAALFEDLGVTPEIEQQGNLKAYKAASIVIWAGDFFELTAEDLGGVDAIYDRAALVALPDALRARYRAHLMAVTEKAPQLLLTYDYDQSKMSAPPFSITADMVGDYYAPYYAIAAVDRFEIPPPGLKGQVPATELAFLLT